MQSKPCRFYQVKDLAKNKGSKRRDAEGKLKKVDKLQAKV
jgi:hypothetical protein